MIKQITCVLKSNDIETEYNFILHNNILTTIVVGGVVVPTTSLIGGVVVPITSLISKLGYRATFYTGYSYSIERILETIKADRDILIGEITIKEYRGH